MLSQELVEEFQKIFKKNFGMDLSLEDARAMGTALVKYYEILLEVSKEDLKNTNKG